MKRVWQKLHHPFLTLINNGLWCVASIAHPCFAVAEEFKASDLEGNAQVIGEIWHHIEKGFPIGEEQWKAWKPIKEQALQVAARTDSSADLLNIAQSMFDEMGASHFQLFKEPFENWSEDDLKPSRNDGHLGISMHWLNDAWYVSAIECEATKAHSMIETGYEIISIGDHRLLNDFSLYPPMVISTQKNHLFGPKGGKTSVSLKKHDGEALETTLPFLDWKGFWTEKFGHLPSIPANLEIYTIDRVKIIRFSAFVIDILPTIIEAIRDAHDLDGIVFDVRSNPGGMGFMANGIVGRLTDQSFSMGTMYMKEGQLNFHVFPQPNPFLGKVAVLIDRWSASASEIFASGIQESGRGKVFGETSMGAALPSKFIQLENGMIFQQAIATIRTIKGHVIEGNGVQPDHPIRFTKQDLIKGKDPVQLQALEWIQESSS